MRWKRFNLEREGVSQGTDCWKKNVIDHKVSIPFKRERALQGICESGREALTSHTVSIPFKRERALQGICESGREATSHGVSVPFKREGVSQADRLIKLEKT